MFLALLVLLQMQNASAQEETRERIVIIDSGARTSSMAKYADKLCLNGHTSYVGLIDIDLSGHGTNLLGIVAPSVDKNTQCITIVKSWQEALTEKEETAAFLKALVYVSQLQNVGFVNISITGSDPQEGELEALKTLTLVGAKVVVAAGNNSKDLGKICNIFPACYPVKKNFYVVASVPSAYSNYGGPVNAEENGNKVCADGICLTGSSQATAVHTSKLIAAKNNKKVPNEKKKSKCFIDFSNNSRTCE